MGSKATRSKAKASSPKAAESCLEFRAALPLASMTGVLRD